MQLIGHPHLFIIFKPHHFQQMPKAISKHQSNWFNKFFECLYLFIAVALTASIMLENYISHHVENFDEEYFISLFLIYCGAAVVIALAYSIWWHGKELKGNFNSAVRHNLLRGILRYFIAYEVSVYGFGKILKTQFAISYTRADIPVGNLSGFELTWFYYSHSYTFAVILGLCQIGGAILLLFRRTTLLGVCVLLPVMINVVLINIFYDIGRAPFVNSLIITFALIYLFSLRWNEIKAVLFANAPSMRAIKTDVFKSITKLLVIVAAFATIWYFISTEKASPFTGKWEVKEFIRNGKVIKDNDWLKDKIVWRNIYFEEGSKVAFSSNHFIFDPGSSNWADYSYDKNTHKLSISLTGIIDVSQYDGRNMQWNVILNSDTLQIKLYKIARFR
jgi:hypothetical protein